MGGTKRLGLHKDASQEKNTHSLNYNKQIQRRHYKNTEHNKHNHIHAPKQTTQHQKITNYTTPKNNMLQHNEKHYDLSMIKCPMEFCPDKRYVSKKRVRVS